MRRSSDEDSGGTPLIWITSGWFCGSGLEISPKATLALLRASFSRSTARSLSALTGVVHLHLQDQVRPALQVKAQVDTLLDRSPQTLAGETAGDADDAEEKEDQHRNNQNCFE